MVFVVTGVVVAVFFVALQATILAFGQEVKARLQSAQARRFVTLGQCVFVPSYWVFMVALIWLIRASLFGW